MSVIPSFFRSDGWVKSVQGYAVAGAQVYVCTQPANQTVPPTPLQPIFADIGGVTPITQPVFTDGFGHYDFYVAPGIYTVLIALGGQIQAVYTDQIFGLAQSSASNLIQVNGTALSSSPSGAANFQNSGTVTFQDLGSGILTASVMSGSALTLQTNGVNNSNQGLLNIAAGGGISIVNSAGTTTISGGSISGTNANGFWGPGLFMTAEEVAALTSTLNQTTIISPNEVRVFQFVIPTTITISHITMLNGALAGVGTTITYGIYDVNGNKLLDSGTFNANGSTSTPQTNTVSPVTFNPGTYYFAQTANNINCVAIGIGGSATQLGKMLSVYNSVASRSAIATNTASAGVLPSTLGTLTAQTLVTATGHALPFFQP